MRRREFLGGASATTLLGGVNATAAEMPTIAVLHFLDASDSEKQFTRFMKGLTLSGAEPGLNIRLEFRYAEGHLERVPSLVDSIRGLKPTVVVSTGGSPMAKAVRQTLAGLAPLVFVIGEDPIAAGLVESLQGGNRTITGTSALSASLVSKRLELLESLFQKPRVAVLVNMNDTTGNRERSELAAMSSTSGVHLDVHAVTSGSPLEQALSDALDANPTVLLVGGSSLFTARRNDIIKAANARRVPVIGSVEQFPRSGALASYGGSRNEAYQKAGEYAGKILAGGNPADLPIWLTQTFDLIINAKVARELSIEIPPAVSGLADEVIE